MLGLFQFMCITKALGIVFEIFIKVNHLGRVISDFDLGEGANHKTFN